MVCVLSTGGVLTFPHLPTKLEPTCTRYDAGILYAREKVSHALRSRPMDEAKKRARPGRKKGQRKSFNTPEIEAHANKLIQEQQQLLRAMLDKKVFPVWMQGVKESLNGGT